MKASKVYSSISGSDLHFYRGHQPPPFGFILGHEVVGLVAEIGAEVKDFKAGDLVVSAFSTSCGESLHKVELSAIDRKAVVSTAIINTHHAVSLPRYSDRRFWTVHKLNTSDYHWQIRLCFTLQRTCQKIYLS